MKNSLMVPAVFIVTFTVIFFILAFFTALALPGSTYILSAGYYQLFFVLMIQTGLKLVPVVALITIPGVFLFLMRHPSSPFLTVPLLILVAFLAWCVFVPFSYFMNDRLQASKILDVELYPEINQTSLLSAGAIRVFDAGKRAVWLSVDEQATVAAPVIVANSAAAEPDPVLQIYPSLSYNRLGSQLVTRRTEILNGVSTPDPLFKAQLQIPSFLTALVTDVNRMLFHVRASWDAGLSRYFIEAGSLCLAVFGLWYFCVCTGWRMLNLVLLSVGIRFLFYVYRFFEVQSLSPMLLKIIPANLQSALLAPLVFTLFGGALLLITLLTALFRRHGAVTRGLAHE